MLLFPCGDFYGFGRHVVVVDKAMDGNELLQVFHYPRFVSFRFANGDAASVRRQNSFQDFTWRIGRDPYKPANTEIGTWSNMASGYFRTHAEIAETLSDNNKIIGKHFSKKCP